MQRMKEPRIEHLDNHTATVLALLFCPSVKPLVKAFPLLNWTLTKGKWQGRAAGQGCKILSSCDVQIITLKPCGASKLSIKTGKRKLKLAVQRWQHLLKFTKMTVATYDNCDTGNVLTLQEIPLVSKCLNMLPMEIFQVSRCAQSLCVCVFVHICRERETDFDHTLKLKQSLIIIQHNSAVQNRCIASFYRQQSTHFFKYFNINWSQLSSSSASWLHKRVTDWLANAALPLPFSSGYFSHFKACGCWLLMP